MELAQADAGVAPDDVDALVAHATGTPKGDDAEIKAINDLFISAGRDKYPTKSGVHITFEKSQVVTMDSATVGIPRNSPDGYYEKVYAALQEWLGREFPFWRPYYSNQQIPG